MLAIKKRAKALKIYLDDEPLERSSALFRNFPVQSILPNAADLLLGPPSLRRSQLDWVLFHVEPEFLSLHINIKSVKTTQLLVALGLPAQNGPDPWADAQ